MPDLGRRACRGGVAGFPACLALSIFFPFSFLSLPAPAEAAGLRLVPATLAPAGPATGATGSDRTGDGTHGTAGGTGEDAAVPGLREDGSCDPGDAGACDPGEFGAPDPRDAAVPGLRDDGSCDPGDAGACDPEEFEAYDVDPGLYLSGSDPLALAVSREVYDPFETFNRKIFAFNEYVWFKVLRPVSGEYRRLVPRPARQGVVNFLQNATEPVSAINNLLQGNGRGAMMTVARFVINTLFGGLGLVDTAGTFLDLHPRKEDYGQTLGYWGVSPGPYLVLPVLGPGNLRDTLVNTVLLTTPGPVPFDPYTHAAGSVLADGYAAGFVGALRGMQGFSAFDLIVDDIAESRRNSIDFYAIVRGFSIRQIHSQVQDNSSVSPVPAVPGDG